MSKIDQFFEEFLDDIQVDIDFNVETKSLEVKTKETRYSDSYELPTMTQLLNQKSDEFIQSLLIDLKPIIDVEIEDLTEWSDSTVYSVAFKFACTLHEAYDFNMTQIYFNRSELEISKSQTDEIIAFLVDNKFKEYSREYPQAVDYRLEIINTEQLTSFLQKLENFALSYKPIKSFKDLKESNIKTFKNFGR